MSERFINNFCRICDYNLISDLKFEVVSKWLKAWEVIVVSNFLYPENCETLGKLQMAQINGEMCYWYGLEARLIIYRLNVVPTSFSRSLCRSWEAYSKICTEMQKNLEELKQFWKRTAATKTFNYLISKLIIKL